MGRIGCDQLSEELEEKAPFDEDSPVLRQFKGLIRKAEARASCQILGLELAKVLFLDLPFYEKGRYRQFNSTRRGCDRYPGIVPTNPAPSDLRHRFRSRTRQCLRDFIPPCCLSSGGMRCRRPG